MDHQPAIVLGILVLALAAPAAAQGQQQPLPKQSIGGGAQWAYPVDSGGDLTATPGLTASWRRWFGPHLGIEAEFGWWQKKNSQEYRSEGYYSPEGFVAEPVEASYTARLTTCNLGVNVLGRIPIGRAAIVAGGGPGLFVERGTSESIFNGRSDKRSDSSAHFGLQSLAGVEVRVTDRLIAFGGFRLELRDVRWVDSLVGYPTAGVRIGF